MCGRYTFFSSPELIAEEFDRPVLPPYVPRWNIAPTQPVMAIRMKDGTPEGAALRWGLIPAWTQDTQRQALLINAKSETAATKPSFRAAFASRRCLILADGYYEWQVVGRQKQAWYYRLKSGRPFGFAGLWECWKQPEKDVESCAVLTTEANDLAAAVHDRMPVILDRDRCRLWLDHHIADAGALQELLRPYPSVEMEAFTVDSMVNKVTNEGPQCIEPKPINPPLSLF